MCKITELGNGGKAAVMPSAIVVYNFESDDAGRLSQLVSAAPGVPVIFLGTKFVPAVFSQAENRNRAFVLSTGFVDKTEVDPVYPVQWLSPGNMFPMMPGNVSVTATDRGFIVETVAPDPQRAVEFP